MKADNVVELIMNVVFIATFIGVLFFTYGSRVEKDVVNEQVSYAVSQLFGDVQFIGGKPIQDMIGQIKPPNMENADRIVAESNKKLIMKVAIVLSVFFVVGTLIAYFIARKYDVDFKKTLVKNIMILIVVAVTEFTFIKLFTSKYKSLDPNFIVKSIIQSVRTNA